MRTSLLLENYLKRQRVLQYNEYKTIRYTFSSFGVILNLYCEHLKFFKVLLKMSKIMAVDETFGFGGSAGVCFQKKPQILKPKKLSKKFLY